jgi:hypothetical protein
LQVSASETGADASAVHAMPTVKNNRIANPLKSEVMRRIPSFNI